MGSDALLVPLVGVAGVIVGVAATILVSRMRANPKKSHSYLSRNTETITVVDEAADAREFRVLRALFGETKGRRLETFKDKYYRPYLEATIEKGWVKQDGKRYYLTPEGAEFCRTYFTQLFNDWKPADQV